YMNYQSVRQNLLDTVIKANQADLLRMSAGNISTRMDDGLIAITPSGIKYHGLTTADISIVDLDGNLVEGPKPSSETPMHTAIYRGLSEVNSICHTHSIYAITFAMLGEAVPMANLELLVCGAPIPVAAWASPGTLKAGELTVEIFKQRPELKVILLRKHGLVAVGSNLDHALDMAFNAEVGFHTYHQALLLGQPEPITDSQLAEIKAVYHR
ncbi:MAG: class II aldolase/adducin family protein, partial [Chloroflexota bacterium]